MTDTLRQLANEIARLAKSAGRLDIRQATVADTATGPNRVDLNIGGSTTPVTGIRYRDGYTPSIGDTVWVLVIGGADRLVIGKAA